MEYILVAVGRVTVLREWLPRMVTVRVPRPGWQRGSLARCDSWTSRRYRNWVAGEDMRAYHCATVMYESSMGFKLQNRGGWLVWRLRNGGSGGTSTGSFAFGAR